MSVWFRLLAQCVPSSVDYSWPDSSGRNAGLRWVQRDSGEKKKKKRPGVVQFRDIVCPTVAFSLDGIHMRLFSSRVCFHRARWRRYHGRWPPPTFVQDNEEEQEPPLSHTVSPLWRRPCVYLLSWVTENHLSSDRCCWLFTSLRKEIH